MGQPLEHGERHAGMSPAVFLYTPVLEICSSGRWRPGRLVLPYDFFRRRLLDSGCIYGRRALRAGGPLVLRVVLGIHESLRSPVRIFTMDYIVGGITAVLLFVYLIYALLKPEKF